MLGSVTGLVAFVGGVAVMLLAVPGKFIARYLWLGLVGGWGVALLLILVLQNVLEVWRFQDVDLLYLGQVPLFLSAVWVPLVIAFGHLVTVSRGWRSVALLIGVFSLMAGLAHWFMLAQGTLIYHRWSLWHTVGLAAVIHAGLAYYLHLQADARRATFR